MKYFLSLLALFVSMLVHANTSQPIAEVVWVEFDNDEYRLNSRQYLTEDKISYWTPEKFISASKEFIGNPVLTVNATGDRMLFWNDRAGGLIQISYIVQTNDSSEWSDQENIVLQAQDVSELTAVADNNGLVYLFFIATSEGYDELFMTNFDVKEGQWGPISQVNEANTAFEMGPHAWLMPEGEIGLSWQSMDDKGALMDHRRVLEEGFWRDFNEETDTEDMQILSQKASGLKLPENILNSDTPGFYDVHYYPR